ncbi:MAG TPA: SpoIIE family protein phosphatase [Candidatus Limnocylindrales bacterium]|nr:SpoIIE family protein phosphatase [Candidatus Limnocylindrales bacterium]
MSVTLARLLDRGRANALLEAFAPLAPRGWLALVDPDGTPVAATREPPAPPAGGVDVHLPDGVLTGRVVGGEGVPPAVLAALARAVEAVLAEIHDRRMVSLEALERYRELALLYRLAGTIGSAVDPAGIVDELLAEAVRALRSEVALVVPAEEGSVPRAGTGPTDAQERVRASVSARLGAILAGSGGTTVETPDGWSLLVTPISVGERPSAALVLGRPPGSPRFASPDQRLGVALAEHASVALERSRLQAHDAERRRLEQEVSLGRRIQRSLLPQRPPDIAGWSFATHYEAATQVGGDFYDFFRLRDRPTSFGLVIADVTGKGIGAALLMAFARPLFRAIADQYPGPAAALTQANRVLVLERPTPLFITAFMGIVDSATGLLRYASAGHEPPLVVPAGRGRVRRLPGSGPLLGAFPVVSLAEHVVQLHPGDLLLLHTDGAIDARDPLRRRFGDVRLARAAGSARGRDAAELVASVAGAVARFAAGEPAADDLALVAVRRDPVTDDTPV